MENLSISEQMAINGGTWYYATTDENTKQTWLYTTSAEAKIKQQEIWNLGHISFIKYINV